LGSGFLSVEQIGKLINKRKVIWTLHDQWAFCGAEHYDEGAGRSRWITGYSRFNRPDGHRGLDIDRFTWLRKKRSWTGQAHIVTPSNWLADCVRESELLGEWPVTVIPNPLDLNVFKPNDKAMARNLLGLPPDEPLILFGAIGGSNDTRKGWDLLARALPLVAKELKAAQAVVFGQSGHEGMENLGMKAHSLGYLHDELTLALAYSAADVVVVPSRQDNLPQTAVEAHGCGRPVVAFKTGGLVDIVEHGVTGYLADPFDVEDLAAGITWTLKQQIEADRLGEAARGRAISLWSPTLTAEAIKAIFIRCS
jgi:glycosyltransferase involved in cell wall biosynthesis